MWKPMLELFTNLVTLTQRLERLEKNSHEQQKELRELSELVNRLAFELQRSREQQQYAAERETSERKMFMLQVENILLKAQHQLSSTCQHDRRQTITDNKES
jgi:uncharacterized coiled-coil protein SlyX